MSAGKSQTDEQSIDDLISSREGVLTVGSARAVVMTEGAYVFLMKVLQEHAPHAIKYAFYDMGYRVGQELMQTLAERADEPEASFSYLVQAYRQSGYGDLRVEQFDLSKPEARLAGSDLFESNVARKAGTYRTPRCVDHYSRGMFAGFLSNLLGKEVVCEEIACQYRGDERCEFVVMPFE